MYRALHEPNSTLHRCLLYKGVCALEKTASHRIIPIAYALPARLDKEFVTDHLMGLIKPGLKTNFSGQLGSNDQIDDEELLLIADTDGRTNIYTQGEFSSVVENGQIEGSTGLDPCTPSRRWNHLARSVGTSHVSACTIWLI